MKKARFFTFLILSITFGIEAFGQVQANFNTQTIKKSKTENRCEITLTNGQVQLIDWCRSPCQRMYGNLPGNTCPP